MNYEEVSYAEDCRMVNHDSPNPYSALYHACFDLFALAHFGGWFFKTLICSSKTLFLNELRPRILKLKETFSNLSEKTKNLNNVFLELTNP